MPCDANFSKLPRDQKIYLMWLWGIQQKEIATVFNITRNHVTVILNKVAPNRPKRAGGRKKAKNCVTQRRNDAT